MLKFKNKSLLVLKGVLILANSVDPDEMPHFVHSMASHLSLHCLSVYMHVY